MKLMRWCLIVLALVAVGCSGNDVTPPSNVLWNHTGSGDTVFNIPSYVHRVRVQASFPGTSSNFILECSQPATSDLFVNELLGTTWRMPSYDGLLNTNGCLEVQVTHSSGVTWAVTESR